MSNNWLQPDWEPGTSINKLPIEHFIKQGIKALIIDVDKTLVSSNEKIIDKSVIEWVDQARIHLNIHLLSNNPSKKRISYIAKQINSDYTFRANKPSRKSAINIINKLRLDPFKIAIIGDRIFTDILLGNRLGLYTVLITPLKSKGELDEKCYLQYIEKRIASILGAK
tara:strand:+ start:396 stop:899 length:504 start_codon:yes stop_codon:yes gene_type:complete